MNTPPSLPPIYEDMLPVPPSEMRPTNWIFTVALFLLMQTHDGAGALLRADDPDGSKVIGLLSTVFGRLAPSNDVELELDSDGEPVPVASDWWELAFQVAKGAVSLPGPMAVKTVDFRLRYGIQDLLVARRMAPRREPEVRVEGL